MKIIRSFILLSLFTIIINSNVLAQQNGSLKGQVFDSLGSVIAGATVIAVDATAKEKSTVTNKQGEFTINGLAPGKYIVRVTAPSFDLYENTEVAIVAGQQEDLTVALSVQTVKAEVQVTNDNQVSTDPSDNASQTVLKGAAIDELPDDPDELQAYLQALAGPTAGPDGAQIMIDGFTGGRLPPKEAIREIRVNQNPFSAEYDRVGFGRIEILTKPGFDKLRGSANFSFNDESLNSRNPFAANRAASQLRNFNGFLSGPIQSKKSSYFLDFSNNQVDNNAVVTATILDPSLNIVGFTQDIRIPTRRLSFSPRIDYQINDKNTLVARYNYQRSTSKNQGVGSFSLPSRASNSSSSDNEIQLTESMIINPKTVNETRFRFEHEKRNQNGDNTIPTIQVSSAFTGGGAQVGLSYNAANRYELQNYTTTSLGKNNQHAVKFGLRLRGVSIKDRSENNYGGTFLFAGLQEVLSSPGCDRTVAGCIVTPAVSSIEQFRQKVLGNTDPRFNPTQFSINIGNPLATVSQTDYSLFATDDWKARKDLTLSFGLRYENQTNIHDNLNFAPRLGVAWAPGAGGAKVPKTVFRGGVGVFFDRFSENTVLRSRRNDGVSQLNYIVTSNQSNLLGQSVFSYNGVTNVPTAAQLTAVGGIASTPYRIANDLQSPYSIQSAISVERSLPRSTSFSATFIMARSVHVLRQRNVNAPVCPTIQVCPATFTTAQIQALRPNPALGNIYQIESSGLSSTQQLALGLNSRLNPRMSFNVGYSLSFAKGDTDSLSSPRFTANAVGFPAYSYDLSSENAPSAFNARHTLFVRGNIQLPWRINLSPLIIASSGRRFNITSGTDTNRDSLFFERPTYSVLNDRCKALGLTNSFCDIGGISNPTTTVIPRNYGRGPGNFNVNLNLNKTFGFGKSAAPVGANVPAAAQTGQDGQTAANARGGNNGGGNRGGGGGGGNRGGGGGGGGAVMMGGGGGGGFFGGGGDARKPYNLTFGVSVQNLFNTVNLNSPIGSLTSPFFGRSISAGGGGFGFFGGGGGGSANRRVDLQLRFSF